MTCRRLPLGDECGCLACGLIFPDEPTWLAHRPCPSYSDPWTPLRDNDSGAVKSAPAVTVHIDAEYDTRPSRGFLLGGFCRSGNHKLTKATLYISPKGVASCRTCRREAARVRRAA